jgi:Winged helix DNA-binding domain
VCSNDGVRSRNEIGLLRLVAQRLAGPGFDTPLDAVRWMTAMQAQDYPGAMTSVALRTRARSRAAIEAALDSGDVVRSYPMRGTLHFVAADDLSWMLELVAARLISAAIARRAALDLDLAMIERARDIAIENLAGGRRLLRAELVAEWERAGLLDVKQRSYHFIWHLAHTGTLCFGPTDGRASTESRTSAESREQYIVLVDEWITRPRQLDHDEALGEWAIRYFCSHGPATVKDFSAWTKLVAADVRIAMTIAKPALERIVVDDTEYYLDPHTPALLDAHRRHARAALLLPGFDEYVLGYTDRSAVVAREFGQRLVPGSNGMFASTVVSDGEVVGTWKRIGTGRSRRILATPFTAFTAAVDDAVPRLFAALP